MKRFNSIAELLIDYRAINKLSQSDFADRINVDTRTVQRWERGETLIKSEKEEEIVINTFLPYQLVRNLNSGIAIPTYYDFRIRKYSLDQIFNEFPDPIWFKKKLNSEKSNLRQMDFKFDYDYLKRYLNYQKIVPVNIFNTIEKAIDLLPKLNSIITDDAGYYSGHNIIFPIKHETYLKLLNKEISEDQLHPSDLVNFEHEDVPVFYNYEITADNNFDIYYLVREIFSFFEEIKKTDYIYCAFATRYDTFYVNEQVGLTIAWEEPSIVDKGGNKIFPRFYSGNFKNFLKDSQF